ncbi:MAG: flagellar basal body rod protein FlgC [Pseudomonadota bacterium]|nr:flagellar basal body rod protein FlgC [Pseudomonadota bacterium]
MELTKAMHIAASAMRAQGKRIQVIAENMANAESAPQRPGEAPYARKIVTFKTVLDEAGIETVTVDRVRRDRSEFPIKYDPNHPGANNDGYVRMPNVNSLIEIMDMREAQRSYEANISMIELSKSMVLRTIELLGA